MGMGHFNCLHYLIFIQNLSCNLIYNLYLQVLTVFLWQMNSFRIIMPSCLVCVIMLSWTLGYNTLSTL